MRELKSITLICENTEEYAVARKDIGAFSMEEIQTVIGRYAINSISEERVCDKFTAQISKDADYSQIPGDPTWFKRVTSDNNITGVDVEWEDGERITYLLPEDNHQSFVSEQGDLYLLIGDDRDIREEFDDDFVSRAEEDFELYRIWDNLNGGETHEDDA